MVQWGANDKRVSREETMEIFNNISSKNKKLVVCAKIPATNHYAKKKGKNGEKKFQNF